MESQSLSRLGLGWYMLAEYFSDKYNLPGSYVIGDRITDVVLAKNLGCKAIFLNDDLTILATEHLTEYCALQTTDWNRITEFLFAGERKTTVHRVTKETDCLVELNLDGNGACEISTGLKFFDHMNQLKNAVDKLTNDRM